MKKIWLNILIIIFVVPILSSCASIRSFQLTAITSEESKMINEQSNKIITCLTKKDKDSFIALFAKKVRERDSFLQEVDDLFSFFECDTYSDSEINNTASGGDSIESGKKVEWHVNPEIVYIKTIVVPNGDYSQINSKYYNVNYYWQITNENNPELEGLHTLNISLLNIEGTIQVGTEEFKE